jgi:hypothetical protein
MNKCSLCGGDANFKFKNGNWCCADNINKCPEKRRRDSLAKKGKVPNWKNGHPHGKLGKPSWNSGKKYAELLGETEADKLKAKLSKSISDIIKKKGSYGQAATPEAESIRRKKISDSIKKRYENGWMPKAGRCKKIHYNSPYAGDVLLDGSWELECAKFLDEKNIKWNRNKNRFSYKFENKDRFYTPDFFLIDYDIYLEVKGYITDKDLAKWKHFPHKIIIAQLKEIRAMKNGTFKATDFHLYERALFE